MSKQERCDTCRMWQEGISGCTDDDDNEMFGLCRREPPKIVEALVKIGSRVTPGQSPMINDGDVFEATKFPITPRYQWCGRFEWLPRLEPMGPLV